MAPELESRLNDAIGKVELDGCVYAGKGNEWDTNLRSNANDPDFFAQVDWAKEVLFGVLAPARPLQYFQSATDLRVVLEAFSRPYFSKSHLAVAMLEMGYRVRYRNTYYFESNAPSKGFIQALKKSNLPRLGRSIWGV